MPLMGRNDRISLTPDIAGQRTPEMCAFFTIKWCDSDHLLYLDYAKQMTGKARGCVPGLLTRGRDSGGTGSKMRDIQP